MQCLNELGMKSENENHYHSNLRRWKEKALKMGIACDCVDIKETFPQFKISLEKKLFDVDEESIDMKTASFGRKDH